MTATLALLALLSASPTPGPGDARDHECLVCHAGIGEADAPKLDPEVYAASAHGDEGCVGCHPDVEDPAIDHEAPDEDLAPAVCAPCHEGPAEAYAGSRHAEAPGAKRHRLSAQAGLRDPARPEAPAATCVGCHGVHDILGRDAAASRVHPRAQPTTCGTCHSPYRVAAGHPFAPPAGEDLRAACSDCHDAHAAAPATDPTSNLAPRHVAETCGRCHEDVRDAYRDSAHADALADPARDVATDPAPSCATCHMVHAGAAPETSEFRRALVDECGTCHAAMYDAYADSYHGKATLLGADRVAKCADCHGAHRIRGADVATSSISAAHKLATCRRCHEGAPENFAGFWAHPDPHDAEGYPALFWVYAFMTTLLVSVLTFFGIHTLLWAIREGVDALKEGRFVPERPAEAGPRVSRFTPFDRFVHLLVVISFLGLAATGAPLKFASASWAPSVFLLFGGVAGAGLLHRIFAVITFVYFALHLGSLAVRLTGFYRQGNLREKLLGPESLVPRLDDLRDIWANLKWFVGAGPAPTYDKWTYWEKFDYWAVFWGVAIIGSSGLVLWFPAFFTQVLPGWAVNIALVVHSDEALLAMAFIFGVHFFNGHLRRAKFPMDEVMFTGSVPVAEYRHERGREWARMVAEGQVEARQAPPPKAWFRAFARVFGVLAWLTGLAVLALIVHGFLAG